MVSLLQLGSSDLLRSPIEFEPVQRHPELYLADTTGNNI